MFQDSDPGAGLPQLFMSHLLVGPARVEADLMDQLFQQQRKRLARLLLRLAHYGGENQQMIPADISQEMLAEMIGTNQAARPILMQKFRKLGSSPTTAASRSTHRCFLRWSNKEWQMIFDPDLRRADQLGR